MALLDTHVHVWRYPEHFNLSLRTGMMAPRPDMTEEEIKAQRDRPVERLVREMEGFNEYAIVVGLKSWSTLGIEVPNESLAECVKPYPGKLWWAAAVVLTDSGAAAEVEHCVKDLGAVALGEIGPGYGHFRVDDPRCFPVYEVARSLDVPLIIHSGPVNPPSAHLKYGDLQALDEVCVNFPELKIVLCHLGYPFYELADFLLTKHPNLYADVSLLPGRAGAVIRAGGEPDVVYPYYQLDQPLHYYFSQAGAIRDKLLWATDNADHKTSIESFRGINGRLEKQGLPKIPDDAIERMFHENWRKVFPKIPG